MKEKKSSQRINKIIFRREKLDDNRICCSRSSWLNSEENSKIDKNQK